MALPRHVDDAADRLKDAERRIEAARAQSPSVENLHSWLSALSDYAEALSELHEFTNESIHEKLHRLLAQLKLREPAPGVAHDDTVPGGSLREGP